MKKIALVFGVCASLIILTFLAFEPLEMQMREALESLRHHPLEYAATSFALLSLDVLLPVPSSIVMYTNAAVLGALAGMLLSLLSAMTSSIAGYGIGRAVNLRGKALAAGKSNERARVLLKNYGGVAIILSRGIPVLAESVSLVCGFSRLSFWHYVLLNFVGYLPVVAIYAVFGQMGMDEGAFLLSFALSILFSGAFWMFGRRWLGKRSERWQAG